MVDFKYMSLITEQFKQSKAKFDQDRSGEDGVDVMEKLTKLINHLGANFTTLNGGELAEIQIKIAGYKFYLADYLAELQRLSEAFKLELKDIRAKRWDDVIEMIKSEKGKVSNKDQIENVLILETKPLINEQMLYEDMHYKYKLKMSAINDILTCVVQRLAELKNQISQSKQ